MSSLETSLSSLSDISIKDSIGSNTDNKGDLEGIMQQISSDASVHYSRVDNAGVRHVDYRSIADDLQADLKRSIDNVSDLQDQLKEANSKIKELSDKIVQLEEHNSILHLENEYLQTENEDQAINYVKLRKELDALIKRTSQPNHIDAIEKTGQPNLYIEEEGVVLEKQLEKRLSNKILSFKKYTDMKSLSPYLIQHQLLTNGEHSTLTNMTDSSECAMHFYTQILPRKGTLAYTMFYECLKVVVEDVSCHSGHKDLLDILQDNS